MARAASRSTKTTWNSVTGPVAALLCSMHRIGWSLSSASTAIDDGGATWDFRRDSPAAIVTACRDSVRRWRLQRVGKVLPGLIPDACDVPTTGCHETILVEFSNISGPFLDGKGIGGRISDEWNPRWRGDLTSAMCGGQWAQTRKTAVPSWGITDNRCQLCLSAVGTLEHRFVCPASVPAGGWANPPRVAAAFFDRLSEVRKSILRNRGLLVLRLPAPPVQAEAHFQWIREPEPSEALEQATWYLDGSLLHGKWKAFRTTGVGIAVVALDGSLLGFGRGSPPPWCRTAAAAEAWALQVVLTICPFPPAMKTDCLSLLRTAEQGTCRATNWCKTLARIWSTIANSLDGDITRLSTNERLVWMPAHQTLAMIGEKKLSNGRRLSCIDWRANRLVDSLAKQAAAQKQLATDVSKALDSGAAAVKHSVMLLGRVTHAANNHQRVSIGLDGETTTAIARDASQCPKGLGRGVKRKADVDAGAVKAKRASDWALTHTKPWTDKGASSSSVRRRTARTFQAAYTKRRVHEIGASLRAPADTVPAAVRLEQLRDRVRERCRRVREQHS